MVFLIFGVFLVLALTTFQILHASGNFKKAEEMRKIGRYASAATLYEKFADHFPASKKAPEAYFQAARLYHRHFHSIRQAQALYQKVIDFYPQSQWSQYAKRTLECFPEYFPTFTRSQWVYGDSQSGGQYMVTREKAVLESATDSTWNSIRALYSGKEKITQFQIRYFLKEKSVHMQFSTDKTETLLFQYPIRKNDSWNSIYLGKQNKFTVVGTGLTVSVRAGTFDNCIKIKRQPQGSNSWVYDYYAPNVGLILNSNATPQAETRITELLSYSNG